jgi:tetratricopeptide (TPR) repeat protein
LSGVARLYFDFFVSSGETILLLVVGIIAIAFVIPLFLSLRTLTPRPYWCMGFRQHTPILSLAFLFSGFVISAPSLPFEREYYAVLMASVVLFHVMRKILYHRYVGWIILLICACLTIFSIVAQLSHIDRSVIPNVLGVSLRYLVLATWAVSGAVFLHRLLTFRILGRVPNPYVWKGRDWKMVHFILLLGLLTATSVLWLLYSDTLKLDPIGVLPLLTLFVSSYPRQVMSRQRSYWRDATGAARHDRLHSISSPTLDETNFFNRLSYTVSELRPLENLWVGIIVSIVAGGVGIPLVQFLLDPQNAASALPDLMLLGVSSALVLGTLYFIAWAYHHRQKYVVLPFHVEGADNPVTEARLKGVGSQLMHAITDEIRHIGALMQYRQVENAQVNAGSALAHFVATGQEPPFINELTMLSSLDRSMPLSLLGTFAVTLTRSLAVIRLSGTLRQQSDGSLVLDIQLLRRGNQIASVVKAIVGLSSIEDIDPGIAQTVAREAAIALILQLGNNYHLASSSQSLQYFLSGLNASNERNWWRAIQDYQQAINAESERTSFGIAHYHLGAALLAVGEIEQARTHFELAEASGPPIAESYYMAAVALAKKHWDKLDQNDALFEQIETRCRLALRLRNRFPEAYHLLGAVHYQRAKLQESSTSTSKGAERSKNTWDLGYSQATRCFRKAIRDYDRQIRGIVRGTNSPQSTRHELDRVLQARMTATHQLADSLRALWLLWEADTFYEDVTTYQKDNLRNLVDRAQTYCLAESWQRAEEFLANEVLTVPEAEWHADANLYFGWALIGGANDLLRFGRFYPATFSEKRMVQNLLGRAITHVDYAIHQRPRFITPRRQTDWVSYFSRVTDFFKEKPNKGNTPPQEPNVEQPFGSDVASGKGIVNFLKRNYSQFKCWKPSHQPIDWIRYIRSDVRSLEVDKLYGADITLETRSAFFIKQLELWLYWQQVGLGYKKGKFEDLPEDRPFDEPFPPLFWAKIALSGEPLLSIEFNTLNILTTFRNQKQAFITELDKIEYSGRLHGMKHAWTKLKYSAAVLDNWKRISLAYKGMIAHTAAHQLHTPHFSRRWLFALYMDITTFTVRLLMEAWAYETAYLVAKEAIEDAELWVKTFFLSDPKTYRVSPFVLRASLATLYATKAYCAIEVQQDLETSVRVNSDCTKSNKHPLTTEQKQLLIAAIHEAQQDVSEALQLLPRHPLALLAQARLYRRQQLYDEAFHQLERLLEVVAPYDPYEYLANWQLPTKIDSEELARRHNNRIDSQPDQDKNSERQSMTDHEVVVGHGQFSHFVSRAKVHYEIAETFFSKPGASQFGIGHLIQATAWMLHRDHQADYLLLLAEKLDQLDRFEDAQAVLIALRKLRFFLEFQTFSVTKARQVEILNCVMESRQERFARALHHAEHVWWRWRHKDHSFNPFKKDGRDYFYEQRLDIDTDDFRNSFKIFMDYFQRDIRKLKKGIVTNALLPEHVAVLNEIGLISSDDLSTVIFLGIQTLNHRQMTALVSRAVDIPYSDKHRWVSKQNADYALPLLDAQALAECTPKLNVNWNISVRLIEFFCRESLRSVEQVCQLINNVVYNRIELRLDAPFDLTERNDQSNLKPLEIRNAAGIETVLSLTKLLLGSVGVEGEVHLARFRLSMRNYLDTKGWLQYCDAKTELHKGLLNKTGFFNELDIPLKMLEDARSTLANSALKLDQQNSIVYFHAAQAHVTIFEWLWQNITNESKSTYAATLAPFLQENLEMARTYWYSAQETDNNGRMKSSLSTLWQSIEYYERIHRYRFINFDEKVSAKQKGS